MGQYRQWVHYREIDQQLHTQLAQLEQELADLQQQAALLKQDLPSLENTIIQALLKQQVTPEKPAPLLQDELQMPYPTVPFPYKPPESVSQALFAWGSLPNFDSQQMPAQSTTPEDTAIPPSPHTEAGLLPPDIGAFVDEHTQTAPLRKLPWWMRNTSGSNTLPEALFQDQQSIRTNRLIERWLQRWGRNTEQTQSAREELPHDE